MTPFLKVLSTFIMLLSRSAAFHIQRKNSVNGSRAQRSIRCFSQERKTSVSGVVYSSDAHDAPRVRLFTKEGCTLCDKVKDVLQSMKGEIPHSLEAVDITDDEHSMWLSKYKYDIPVLHIGNKYWTKHRISDEDARKGLMEANNGTFFSRSGDPDAGEMERRQAERTGKR